MKSNLFKYSIGITTIAFSQNKNLVNQIKSHGFKLVKPNIELKRFSESELILFLKECDFAIVGLDKINDNVLKNLPKLKIISKYGVGLDNIDFDACKKYNVEVIFPKGVNKRSVSELALGFMLGIARNIYRSSNLLKDGKWEKIGGFQLSEKKVGIIGLGYVGKDLVKLLKPFNCDIYANDIIDIKGFCQQNNIKSVSKEFIYKNCDFVSLHVPATELTKKMINSNSLKYFKKGSVLINTARGELIDHDSLNLFLKNELTGAGIDVYSTEPPSDIDLLSNTNLINTPHIGGNSKEAVLAMGQSSIYNLINHISKWQ